MTKVNNLWAELSACADDRIGERIDSFFDADPGQRMQTLVISAPGVTADLSKNLILERDFHQLVEFAISLSLDKKVEAMFNGEAVNTSEGRAVLHTLLRNPSPSFPDASKAAAVRSTLAKLETFVTNALNGGLGYQITDVVNIGIGGSHLGPALVCDALRDYRIKNIQTHFVSNVDAALLDDILGKIRPESTLFVIASKSFTTAETLLNANTVRDWFSQQGGDNLNLADHFIAVSSAIDKVTEFGINEENIFPMWDWVGGRYSLWSAIGLPIALQCGFSNFRQLLDGAAAMDEHFRSERFEKNLPAALALLGVWQSNFLGYDTRAVIPYDDRLKLLPAFLQQLEMESNGKQVSKEGDALDETTSPVVWGGVGTDAQHAFFQQLHQGTSETPIDFIICKQANHEHADHHLALQANCFAQAEALMCGTQNEADPERLMIGNHSSNMFLLETLTPFNLGSLLAMYEHRTMFQGALWGINSFDQFGVELGKKLAGQIEQELQGGPRTAHDPSTEFLINTIMEQTKP
ncbi:MAG: glucose-6-phosphate isomerase [Pseudomonadota bacterium]